MILSWRTYALSLLAIQIGILIQVPLVYGKLSADQKPYEAKSELTQPGLDNSRRYPVLEERGLFGRIRSSLEKLTVWIKEKVLAKVLESWHTRKPTQSCYPSVGCFHYNEGMRLEIGGPQSPEEVNTTFYFFKNGSIYIDDLLNENKTTVIPDQTYTVENWTYEAESPTLDIDKPLTVVTHGLTGSKRTPWMMPLVRALLDNINTTVLVVDWEQGANGSYPDAGLDPAGWLYENTKATLTKEDAEYVDVIHTDAGSITNFRIGLNQSVGHVDFYPNGGTVQTGCKDSPNLFYTDYMDVITCSHYRATTLFIESLVNKSCSFISWGCKNWKDFTEGDCLKRQPNTSVMGYYSYTANGSGDQFLYTNSRSPYCRGNDTSPPKQDTILPWWKRIWRNRWWKSG